MKKIIKINFICVLILVICSLYGLSYAVEDETSMEGIWAEEAEEAKRLEEQERAVKAKEAGKAIKKVEVEEPEVTEGEQPEGTTQEPTQEQTELDALKTKKSDIESDVSHSYLEMGILQHQMTNALIEVENLNLTILETQAEIEKLEAEQEKLENEIRIVEIDLNDTTELYNEKKRRLSERLVAIYEMGETTYLDMLLHSKSLGEFLSNYYMISEIAKVDQDLIESFSITKARMEKLSKTLTNNKIILDQSKEAQEQAKIVLQNNLVIQNSKLALLTEEERAMHEQIAAYQEEISKIESEIKLLSLACVGAEYVGGVMAWPVPGYTRITSPFGMRTHPITGIYKLHTGVDIGAPMGAQFIAANDGIVVKAGYNVAYGNMVILDHGGGVQTLYAHGSQILVENGDIIKQGTPVLAVGSTGYSTGPHAHFEVRINGEYVEPLDYITSYNIKKINEVEHIDEPEEETAEDEVNENSTEEGNERYKRNGGIK